MGIKSNQLLFRPHRDLHAIYKFVSSLKKYKRERANSSEISFLVRKIAEHKHFRSSVSISGVSFVLALAFLQHPTDIQAYVEATSSGSTTPDAVVATKGGNTWPINGSIATYFSSYHPGIDILSPIGTPIHAFYKGVIIDAGFQTDGYGNMVLIDHQNGFVSRYAHLQVINVKVGDSVTEDTIIGLVGLTGRTTGPHLHFEIYENGKAIDPLSILSTVQNAKGGDSSTVVIPTAAPVVQPTVTPTIVEKKPEEKKDTTPKENNNIPEKLTMQITTDLVPQSGLFR